MATFFMSHSKGDKRGRLFFDQIFASTHHQAYWYSFEGPVPPHASSIKTAIKQSCAMFVILSEKMDNNHTRAWVGYEVGLMAGRDLTTWVFEYVDDDVNVPVPFVSGFLQYTKKLEKKNQGIYLKLINALGGFGTDDGENLMAEVMGTLSNISCPYEDCIAPYSIYNLSKEFDCPVCKRGITLATKFGLP